MEDIAHEPPAKRARPKVSRTERAAQLRAQAAALERRDKDEARKQDTLCKIVVGGMVLAAMKTDSDFAATIAQLLKERVTRERDQKAIAHLL